MFETLRSDTSKPVPFDNETGLAIIYNPTNNEAVQHAYGLREYAEYLWPNKLKKPQIIYAESEPSVEANAEMLASLERDGKWHYSIHGGDGTYHNVLLAAAEIEAKGIFVTVADGNACDLAHSLHTKFYQQDPINALVYGNTGKLRTLDITIEKPDGDSFNYQAISYAGIGLSAIAALAFGPASLAALADLSRRLSRATTMALYSMMISAGMTVGILLASALFTALGNSGVVTFFVLVGAFLAGVTLWRRARLLNAPTAPATGGE